MAVQITLPTLLGVLFIALKLMGYIAWSWLWVLSPFWIPVAIFLIIFLAVFLFGAALHYKRY